jgi:hypothetical protein
MKGEATLGLKHDETKVLLDPYATSVVSRARWGERGNQDLDYENPAVLGLADTWPQAATPLPDPNEKEFDWQVSCNHRLKHIEPKHIEPIEHAAKMPVHAANSCLLRGICYSHNLLVHACSF